jgi:hypothetical protein
MTDENRPPPIEGRCTCGAVQYRLASEPLFVHCCHCRWCQRETGSAFALNAMIETDRIELLAGTPERSTIPTQSGRGQIMLRCPSCRIVSWSHYAGAGEAVAFVRVGTLLDPDRCPPDIHIFTDSRQPWVVLPEGVPVMPAFYRRSAQWPPASLERWQALQQRLGRA